MSNVDYWKQVKELSRKNSECHKALLAFLEKTPRPSGVALLEYDRLSTAYAAAFSEWFGFCDANAGNRDA